MKVLLIAPHPFFETRGSPIAERALLRALAEEDGYQLHVLTYAQGTDPEIPGCTIHRTSKLPGVDQIPPGFSWKKVASDAVLLATCWRLAARLQPDVLHGVEEAVFIALLVGKRYDIPVVYDMDSSLREGMVTSFPWLRAFTPLLRRAERFAVRRSDAVVAVNGYLQELARTYDPEKRLVVKIEDKSLLETHTEGEEDLRQTIGRDGPLILYVGNLAPYQGIDLLVEGFAHAASRIPDAQLVIVGGDPERIQDYGQRAAKLGLDERIHFVGRRPLSMLGTLLPQADVLVSPRISGGNTPMKIYSYLDSGRPILATRLPTHTEVLDEATAYLVDPEPEALARGLVELLGDADLRRRLGERARAEAREHYSAQAFRRKVVGFYGSLGRVLAEPATGNGRDPSTNRWFRSRLQKGDPALMRHEPPAAEKPLATRKHEAGSEPPLRKPAG